VTAATGETRLLANCVVGLGFSYRGFQQGLAMGPDMIGCDAGSADMGPVYLGSGLDPKSTLSLERDLRIMIEGSHSIGVPLVVGSCGGAGSEPHLDGFRQLVDEIAHHLGIHLRVALIHADQDRASLHAALDAGRIRPLGPFADLTHHAINESAAVVAMMGAAPLVDALREGPDVVLAGRCADPAIFAPTALLGGRPPGPAWHAAKSIDKGYLATATPREGSPVLATITDDSFVIEPTKPGVVCTVDSVARMTMHENPDPFVITQPSGDLLTGDARYEQLEGGRVRVTGSRFQPATQPSVKLEGARLVGHRTILLAGIRDPRLLACLDDFLDSYRTLLERIAASLRIDPQSWSVRFRSYGHDAVLGKREPERDRPPHEVGLIVDVVADTQELATALASRAGPTGSRFDFTGRLGGGGNFAYPFSPSVLRVGPVYEWSVWHILDVNDERDPFHTEMVQVG
jgi:Acyclic terpene utilisation family protein AtuA